MSEDEGITVGKHENFSEWYTQIVSKAGLADVRYGVQGFIVHMPWGFRILREIQRLLERDVESTGHEPFLFPTVIPEKSLLKEKEHAGFAPDVFWVTKQGDREMEERVALRPTGETAIYPMYSLWIRSHKDLPYLRYQSRITVFRNEKTTRPFLRGREFIFFETHDVFETHKESLEQIKRDVRTMENVVWKILKLPFIFFKRPQWDKFKGADDTYASDTLMPDGRRNQMSSTHDLGQRFARTYGIYFKNEKGEEELGWQTCFGPGIWRIMAALIGIHGDDNGLVLPFEVAPLKVVIVPILFSGEEELSQGVILRCRELLEKIKKLGYSCTLDDSEKTPGYKFNHWELLGVPLRLEIGPKEIEKDFLTIVRRTTRERKTIPLKNLALELKKQRDTFEKELELRALEYFTENTKKAKDFEELKMIIEKHRGFVKVPFCSMELDGEECAEILKAETTADVCGTRFENPEPTKGEGCIVCGKKAKHIVYVAKSI
ncbi:MAG: proline--tRNA ligase [Candidatus Methanofastidiosia archaeon]